MSLFCNQAQQLWGLPMFLALFEPLHTSQNTPQMAGRPQNNFPSDTRNFLKQIFPATWPDWLTN